MRTQCNIHEPLLTHAEKPVLVLVVALVSVNPA